MSDVIMKMCDVIRKECDRIGTLQTLRIWLKPDFENAGNFTYFENATIFVDFENAENLTKFQNVTSSLKNVLESALYRPKVTSSIKRGNPPRHFEKF